MGPSSGISTLMKATQSFLTVLPTGEETAGSPAVHNLEEGHGQNVTCGEGGHVGASALPLPGCARPARHLQVPTQAAQASPERTSSGPAGQPDRNPKVLVGQPGALG